MPILIIDLSAKFRFVQQLAHFDYRMCMVHTVEVLQLLVVLYIKDQYIRFLCASREPTCSPRFSAYAALIVVVVNTSSNVIPICIQAKFIIKGRLIVGDDPGLKSVDIATGTPRQS